MALARHHAESLLAETAELSRQFVQTAYERFDSALRGYLLNNLRNEADAEEFLQEVYTRLAGQKDPRNVQSQRAFVFTTAKNLLRDRSRRLATRLDQASICVEDVTLESHTNDPALRLHDAEHLNLLYKALDGVSSNCRSAFMMSRVDGMSYAEIAQVMGVSVSMVEKHISAALRALTSVEYQ